MTFTASILRSDEDSSDEIEILHVGKPNTGDVDDFVTRVREIFDRKVFTNNGPVVREFEAALCAFLGVAHCIPICNATIGLLLLAREVSGARSEAGGEVIVPAFTFAATPHSLRWQNLTPVFCDIDPSTHNLDPREVEALIGPNTRGILGVHVWGRQCAVEELEALSRKYHLPLFFDAAHAFACSHRGRMIGNFGDAEVFSFHATKFFNTFEGGAIATHDDELAHRLRLSINFGFAGLDSVETLGINGKMNEISAAMGLCSLDRLSEFVELNRSNYLEYHRAFAGLEGITLQTYSSLEMMNYQYVVAEIDPEAARFSRDELVSFLHSRNIRARRYFYPSCHQIEPYRSERSGIVSLPASENLSQRVLCFPNGTSIGFPEIHRIAENIAEFQQKRMSE